MPSSSVGLGLAAAACGAAAAVAAAALARRLRRHSGPIYERQRTVRHVVQLSFTAGAPVADILQAFDEMAMAMPDLIQSYERGVQNSPEPHTKGLTHIFLLTFASPADRDAYLPHPVHEAFGKQWIAPYLKELTVCDYEIAHEFVVEDEPSLWSSS